jgi:peroxiredoxin
MRFACLLVLLATGCDRGGKPGMVGSPAPDFTLPGSAHPVTLSQLHGRVVLLNFWASWCAPCIEEIPSLKALHEQLPQLEILAVSTDKDADEYNHFLSRNPLPFDLVRDPTDHTADLYRTDGVPETFIIDSQGIVRRHFVGPVDWTSPAILDYLRKI